MSEEYSDELFNKEMKEITERFNNILVNEELKAVPATAILSLVREKREFIVIDLDTPLFAEARENMSLDDILYGMGKTCPFLNIDAIFTVSEAWVGTDPKLEPSKDPNRWEVLIVAGKTFDGRANMTICNIKREGEYIRLKDIEREVEYIKDSEETVQVNLNQSFIDGYNKRDTTPSKTNMEVDLEADIMSKLNIH